LQFNQLNARPGLRIYYPRDCSTFPYLDEFTKKFDPHTGGTEWIPVEPDQEIEIKKDIFVRMIRNNHIPAPTHVVKSFSFIVERKKRKLKQEYVGLPGHEIASLKQQLGDAITVETREKVLGYSGDTPVENIAAGPGIYNGGFAQWDGTQTLIHEATLLKASDVADFETRGNKHSTLEQVMEAASKIDLEKLVLGHFSSRYSAKEIDAAIAKYKQ
jgi:ribonuclease Z